MQSREDPLVKFAGIEQLVSKVYFRFSHLFLDEPELRDFWWQMAKDEEQHASVLMACKALVESHDVETLDPGIGEGKAEELRARMESYLGKGTRSISVDEAFKIALEIEGSELDAIYSMLLNSCGPDVAKNMEHISVPASVQRRKLSAAVLRFAKDPEVKAAARSL